MDYPLPEGNVNVTLTLSNNQTILFTMNDAEFIFACGLEAGVSDEANWLIRGPKITSGSESLEIWQLNLILEDISKMNPPYMYSGEPLIGEGFNKVLRNGIEYTVTAATYSILNYKVIEPNFSTYLAEASGSYFIEIESPTGEKESILVSFSPMLQTDYGGGC
ncbi:MAG: hypothetical protein ACON5F_15105 [Jejuia sp.]